jgi:hypothetical protein
VHPKPALRGSALFILNYPASKPLFLVDQFKVVMKNMNGEPVLPTDEAYAESETP